MRRKQPMIGKPIALEEDVCIVVTNDGAVRIDESTTDDLNYGRRLAARISRSLRRSEDAQVLLEAEAAAPKGYRAPTAWTSYKRMLHSNAPRFEQSRPREFNLGSCIQCLPGRKEPKRGC